MLVVGWVGRDATRHSRSSNPRGKPIATPPPPHVPGAKDDLKLCQLHKEVATYMVEASWNDVPRIEHEDLVSLHSGEQSLSYAALPLYVVSVVEAAEASESDQSIIKGIAQRTRKVGPAAARSV
jgi:hypothetical protein